MFYFYDPTLVFLIWTLFFLSGITLLVFFILTLVAAMNCFNECRPRNRDMDPAHVWFSLIPLFGLVWSYFVVIRLEEALRREYRSRDMRLPKDFGQPIGLTALICWHAGALLCFVGIGVLGYMAAAGFFVVYWQKLMKTLKQLTMTRSRRGSRDDYEEEEYDRPRRRSRRDDDYDDDEEDRPRRRSRRDRDDEDEEDDRRRSSRRRDEEDDDEPPPRRKRNPQDDDEPRRSPPAKPDKENDWKR